ncbi:MAG: hypothetical protein K8S62_03100 [Candidatus Sabulitectum sp.]|nr:hypothetical protein [Candidatus Sabulitectum sp.]
MLFKTNGTFIVVLLLILFAVQAFCYDAVWVCGKQTVFFSPDGGQHWGTQFETCGQGSCSNLDIEYPGYGAVVGTYIANLVTPVSAGPGTPWSYYWGADIIGSGLSPVLGGVDNRGTRKLPIVCGSQSNLSETYGIISLRYLDSSSNYQWLTNWWEDYRFCDIDMFDADISRGYAVGFETLANANGIILSTSNGGTSWSLNHTERGKIIRGIQADCDGNGTSYAVGNDGLVLKKLSAGTWASTTAPCTDLLNDVHFINQDVGWVVGWGGAIFKTTNGGNTWTDQSTIGNTWNAVFFKDSNTGWVVGTQGKVLTTTDSGANWTEHSIAGYYTHLQDVEVVSYTSTDEFNTAEPVFGTVSSNSLIDNHVAYSHEEGVLNMSVETSGTYSVTMFDISGRTVCETNLGNLDAGTHSISVPVNSNLSRGVYHCTVHSNGEIITTNSFLVL